MRVPGFRIFKGVRRLNLQILFAALATFSSLAQVKPTSLPCKCTLLLAETISRLTTIYAGFEDKVTPSTKGTYLKFVRDLKAKSPLIASDRACFNLLEKYTGYFKDHHLGVWYGIQSSAAQIRKIDIRKFDRAKDDTQDSLAGIWISSGDQSSYRIVKDPTNINKYLAVTLSTRDSAWLPGMVKAEIYDYDAGLKMYRGMYYKADFSGVLNGFTLKGPKLASWFAPSWFRKGAQVSDSRADKRTEFKIINEDFIYIKLAHFDDEDVSRVDSLIQANRARIARTRNLIFDLRGNPGGNAASSNAMIGLIYTNPIILPAWEYRSSPELIHDFKGRIIDLQSKEPNNTSIQKMKRFVLDLEEHPGAMVSMHDSTVRTQDSICRFPERVAFLIDHASGSSSEFFTFEGKQSKKVTLFGENSIGSMDYGDVQEFRLACGNYQVGIPWGRNGWVQRFGYRIDNIGFAPAVRIPRTESDWVAFVMKYWAH